MASRPELVVELRKHPRAQLSLPVRIRWQGPLGMRVETAKTVDVSKGGLLVERAKGSAALGRVWIAFPFDPTTGSSVQPETPARIVRVEGENGDGYRVALHIDLPSRDGARPIGHERRAHVRLPFVLPVFVRPVSKPWPEESMTCDVSPAGTSFETSHIYALGDAVYVKIPWGEWGKAGEIHGRVVRVEYLNDQSGLDIRANPEAGVSAMVTRVSVRWTKPSSAAAASPRAPLRP
jgi:hypothetical protein